MDKKRREVLIATCRCIAYCSIPFALTAIQGCEDSKSDNNDSQSNNNDSNNGDTDGSGDGNPSNSIVFNLDEQPYTALKTIGNSIVTDKNSLDNLGFLLYRKSSSEVLVFTRRCTHAGYEIRAFSNGVSVCSSGHGGKFDLNGKAVSGPASGSLKQYKAVLNGNILTIT